MYRKKTNKWGIERRISGSYCLMYRKKTNKRGIERRLSGKYWLMYMKNTDKRGIERRISGSYCLMFRLFDEWINAIENRKSNQKWTRRRHRIHWTQDID
jgi:hypothetical protein